MCLSQYAMIILASTHISATAEFNERNPGIGMGCEVREGFFLEVGAYENSFHDTSFYGLGIVETQVTNSPLHVGAFVGVAHYPDADQNLTFSVGDAVPVAGLQLRYGPLTLRGTPMPKGSTARGVVAAMLRIEF